MDLFSILTASSTVAIAIGGPVLGYIIKQRDAEIAELKRIVEGLRGSQHDTELAGAQRDTRLAVLETRIETLDHVVTRGEFDGAMRDLRQDIREIKDYVMPSPQRGRYGSRFQSSDSMHAPSTPKDPKDR